MKKTTLVIMMVIIMSMVAATAHAYSIIVHVTGSGSGWYQIDDGQTEYVDWSGTVVIDKEWGDSWFECYGSNNIPASDHDEGPLHHGQDDHFYLDLTGEGQLDPTIPQTD
jgi:hypothetical protein